MNNPRNLKLPRGIRNHNPGNIKAGMPWYGLDPLDTHQDPPFAVFTNPLWGLRVLFMNLRARRRAGATTIQQIAEAWAPRSENDTDAWAQVAAKPTGYQVNEPMPNLSRDFDFNLACGIIKAENGTQPYPDDLINAAWYAARVSLPWSPPT